MDRGSRASEAEEQSAAEREVSTPPSTIGLANRGTLLIVGSVLLVETDLETSERWARDLDIAGCHAAIRVGDGNGMQSGSQVISSRRSVT